MSADARLFEPTIIPEPLELAPDPVDETRGPLNAADVKEALRRRHPGDTHGSMPGQWTCIEEWLNIDLLALNAWQKADVIGYEVKISRSDLRRELLKPHKRADALSRTTEFYLAVPAGLLTADEIAYEEPEWEDGDFKRVTCPGVPEFGPQDRSYGRERRYGGRCRSHATGHGKRRPRKHHVRVPLADVVVAPAWMQPRHGESEEAFQARVVSDHRSAYHDEYAVCWICDGKGYIDRSRVEREAPTCWVPRDLGLLVVTGSGCRVVKPSPKRRQPESVAPSRKLLNDLVRWVSHRPDPRHR